MSVYHRLKKGSTYTDDDWKEKLQIQQKAILKHFKELHEDSENREDRRAEFMLSGMQSIASTLLSSQSIQPPQNLFVFCPASVVWPLNHFSFNRTYTQMEVANLLFPTTKQTHHEQLSILEMWQHLSNTCGVDISTNGNSLV